MTGEKTSVHKPLLSAGDVTDKGHALWLDGNVGYIIQKDSPILTALRTCFQRVCEQHSWNGAIDLQVAGGDGNIGQAVDVRHWGQWLTSINRMTDLVETQTRTSKAKPLPNTAGQEGRRL